MEARELDGSSRVAHDPAVAEAVLDGEAVLYHEQLRTVCVLDPVATLIWSHLDGRTSLDAIAVDLAAAFGAELDQVRSDVIAAVRVLGQRGLLDGVEPDPAVVEELTLEEPAAESQPDA